MPTKKPPYSEWLNLDNEIFNFSITLHYIHIHWETSWSTSQLRAHELAAANKIVKMTNKFTRAVYTSIEQDKYNCWHGNWYGGGLSFEFLKCLLAWWSPLEVYAPFNKRYKAIVTSMYTQYKFSTLDGLSKITCDPCTVVGGGNYICTLIAKIVGIVGKKVWEHQLLGWSFVLCILKKWPMSSSPTYTMGWHAAKNGKTSILLNKVNVDPPSFEVECPLLWYHF